MLRRAISQRKKKKGSPLLPTPEGNSLSPFSQANSQGGQWWLCTFVFCWPDPIHKHCSVWVKHTSDDGVSKGVLLGSSPWAFTPERFFWCFSLLFFTITHREREWALLFSPLGWAVVTKTPLSLLLLDDGQTPKRVAKKSHWLAWTKCWVELGE